MEPFSLSSIEGDSTGVFVGTNDNNVYNYKLLSGEGF